MKRKDCASSILPREGSIMSREKSMIVDIDTGEDMTFVPGKPWTMQVEGQSPSAKIELFKVAPVVASCDADFAAGGEREWNTQIAYMAPSGEHKFEAPRQPFVGANWKCTLEDGSDVDSFLDSLSKSWAYVTQEMANVEVCVCPPYVFLDRVRRQLPVDIHVGSQNVGEALSTGQTTGTVTPKMLKGVGCKYVLLGHSDRRNSLGETDPLIAEKVAKCLEMQLGVNLTIGETRAARDGGAAIPTLLCQLAAATSRVPENAWHRVIVAYEPVWAIGEGATPCTPAETQRVLGTLRNWLSEHVSGGAAEKCRFVYTGSVNEKNAEEYASLSEVDGFVVGRAGLDASKLISICRTLVHHKTTPYVAETASGA